VLIKGKFGMLRRVLMVINYEDETWEIRAIARYIVNLKTFNSIIKNFEIKLI